MQPKLETLFRTAIQTRSEDRCREFIIALQSMPTSDVLRFLMEPTNSRTVRQRYISAWILGEVGYPKRQFVTERLGLLKEFARDGQPTRVRARSLLSLGNMDNGAAWRAILPHQRDPNRKIRLTVAQALSTCNFARGIAALYRLSRDKDDHVREWAVFGLTRPRLPHRRKILRLIRPRLIDKNRDVRIEAVIAQVEHRGDEWRSSLIRTLETEGVHRRLVDCINTLISNIR
jgi:HEAT repeat protein